MERWLRMAGLLLLVGLLAWLTVRWGGTLLREVG